MQDVHVRGNELVLCHLRWSMKFFFFNLISLRGSMESVLYNFISEILQFHSTVVDPSDLNLRGSYTFHIIIQELSYKFLSNFHNL